MDVKPAIRAKPLILEKTLPAPANRVWQALTDSSQMRKWYFDIPEFKPEPGFEFRFTAGSESKTYVHLCKVTEVIPGRKIAYTWRYQDCPGESEVSFELFPEGSNTRVRVTHSGLESFPQDSKDFAKESFTEGWNQILGTSLWKFVEAK
ncbi:MAG TPA: SRPBCC family protein [Puia sp.]